MTTQEFWDLIGLLDWQNIDADQDDAVTRPLVEALSMKEPREITAFDDLLSEFVFNLDCREAVEAAGISGLYEELYLYSRLCVIANGEDAYGAVLEDPSLMTDKQFEELLFAAERAWNVRTNREYHHKTAFSMELGANKARW